MYTFTEIIFSAVKETPKVNRTGKLTEDCRQRIRAVSEAKLHLVQLQTECTQDERKRAEEEHNLKIIQMKEIHKLKIEKQKVELEILRKNLLNSNKFAL